MANPIAKLAFTRLNFVRGADVPVHGGFLVARALSVVGPTVCAMAEQRTTHLRVVRPTGSTAPSTDAARAAYWAEVQALRDQRRRLRAG